MKFSIIAITIAASLVPGIMGHPVAPYVETMQLASPEIAKNDTMKPTWRSIWKREDPSITDLYNNNTMKPTWRTIWKREDPSAIDLYNNNTMKPTWRTIWKRDEPSIPDSKNNTMNPTWRTIWKREDSSTTIDYKNNTMKPTWRTIWKRDDLSTIDYKNNTTKPTWHNIWKREHASSPGMMRHQAFFNAAHNATAPNAGIKHLKSSKAGKNNSMKPAWRLVSKREQYTTRLY